jgi:ABC-type multidrug transport system ATPase subunit
MTVKLKLVNVATNDAHSVAGEEFVVGRSFDADLMVMDGVFSQRQFRIVRKGDRFLLEQLSKTVPTFCDDEPVRVRKTLRDGMQIRAGQTRFTVHLHGKPADKHQPRASYEPVAPPVDFPAFADRYVSSGSEPQQEISEPLPDFISIEENVVIGRDVAADVYLEHIQVSRRHARIFQRGDESFIQDLGSANGTFVDGELVTAPRPLKMNAVIRIGPYSLTFVGQRLVPTSAARNSQLEGRGLTRRVPDKDKPGETKTILDDVSLVIRPREFVCLLGPSGSGKSTLLSALSARTPANFGRVLINGSSLYDNFESLKSDIALVPQRDILHESLSVEDALRYTARLRLPVDTSTEEIERRIDDLLRSVGLEEHREKQIRVLSGGQQRRASLANELISNPSLLFLDEVTSGLDEETDREMMCLFRRLADSGMTIVCVTHSLVNIPDTCHLVVFLTVGGKMAFVGTPQEALRELHIERLGAMYKRLEDKDQVDLLKKNNIESETYKKHVVERFSDDVDDTPAENVGVEKHYWNNRIRTVMHQLPLLLRRYHDVFLADRQALYGLLMQCLVVASVLFLVFGNVDDRSEMVFRRATLSCNVLFVLAVSCFWFGCNNAAKEIVKERGIYTKELQANLDPTSFYLSKFLLQLGVIVAQAMLLLFLVNWWCHLPGNLLSQAHILVLGGAAGIAVGLFISSVAVTEETALTLVPLVLIPQIILSDVFIQLEGISKFLGAVFASNYWIYGAMRGTLPNTLVEQLNTPLAPPISFQLAVVAIGAQIATLGMAAIFVLHVRDRAMASTNKSLAEAVREISLFRAVLGLVRKSQP